MRIPFYSAFKANLENQGLDEVTSGQIAWFKFSALVSFFVGLFSSLFILASLFSKGESIGLFLFLLVLIFPAFLFVLLSLYKKFILINLCFVLIVIFCSVFKAPIIVMLWFCFVFVFMWFIFKLPLLYKFFFSFVYLMFSLYSIIIFAFATGLIHIG